MIPSWRFLNRHSSISHETHHWPLPWGSLVLAPPYRDANGGQEASLFVKQTYWRTKGILGPGSTVRLGRFEFIDGQEITPKDPTLAWLKRERVSHRLLGNFGFTHVQRSFDGGHAAWTRTGGRGHSNLTLFAGMPTAGVFDLDGGATLDEVKVGYAAVTQSITREKMKGEIRLFGLHYLDARDGVTKIDNRPARARMADRENVVISTVGGPAMVAVDSRRGKVDGLLWGAYQFGDFGKLSHRAFSLLAELGFQPKSVALSPWIRVGVLHSSGDGKASDDKHRTFFPVLVTPRLYARFPFYTLSNLNDAFAQVVMRPSPRLSIRSDVHCLWLADSSDLWYVGGGA